VPAHPAMPATRSCCAASCYLWLELTSPAQTHWPGTRRGRWIGRRRQQRPGPGVGVQATGLLQVRLAPWSERDTKVWRLGVCNQALVSCT
jgi:hypothetical protein